MDLTNKILRADDTVEEVTDAAVNERATELYMGSAPRVRMAVIRGDAVLAG